MCVCVCVCGGGGVRGGGGGMVVDVCVCMDVFHLMDEHNQVLPIHFLCRSFLTGNTTGVSKLIGPVKIQ